MIKNMEEYKNQHTADWFKQESIGVFMQIFRYKNNTKI